MTSLQTAVDTQGFAVIEGLLDCSELKRWESALSNCAYDRQSARNRSGVYAIRNLLSTVPEIAELSRSPKIIETAREVLGFDALAVKGTLFDKTMTANWLVPWHQDLTICVNNRVDVDGYGPWTIKAGIVNVQPPTSILERMLAIRIHLDDCGAGNGALRVLPASHTMGRLGARQIAELRERCAAVSCEVNAGGVVLMKPLLVHASSPARNPRRRRVIHIDFAATQLPSGLSWPYAPGERRNFC